MYELIELNTTVIFILEVSHKIDGLMCKVRVVILTRDII
jgi:hypothetical protein